MENSTLDVSNTTLSMLHELSLVEKSSVQGVLDRALDCYRRTVVVKNSHLAPDGLPWPPGYFDRPPRVTFEEALARFGVRPNHYKFGRPVYTEAETTRPEYRCDLVKEPKEIQDYWNEQWAKWEAKRIAGEGVPQK